MVFLGENWRSWLSHLLFAVNYDRQHLNSMTGHLWSVCVEVHFYVFIGVLVAVTGSRGFTLLPFLCIAITAGRVASGTELSIATHKRVDEILAGACLALAYHDRLNLGLKWLLGRVWQAPLMVLLLVSCHPSSGPMNYLRPYFGAALVGSTLWRPEEDRLNRALGSRFLKYMATVSYALYVIHPATMYGWLGGGGRWEKYLLKRPISAVLTFGLAHLSTHYYEKRWISLGKKLTTRWMRPAEAA